ncbi:anti-phage dCTP deaminase [Roseateles sp.]|uniref:anti-phage dCTP deaminase n=1 Tax=Roseateles sp. TaxID=1971397 RepID=UPI002F40621F
MHVTTVGEKKDSKVLHREARMAVGGNVAALRQPETTAQSEGEGRFNAKRRIDDAMTPELVIALCGPLGTPLHRVSQTLKELLEKSYDYKLVDEIRLSRFIKEKAQPKDPNSILDLIEAGNALRKVYGNSVLAQLAIREIATVRQQQREDFDDAQLTLAGVEPAADAVVPTPVVRHCHIIDSIKNTDELGLLRSVYGRLLHVISVHSPLPVRVNQLQKKLGDMGDVYKLIDRDSGEEFANGQSVRDVFPQADFFLRISDGTDDQIRASLTRYLDLLLGAKIITPTSSERAMYEAHSAARNSACLSRQVGAAITDASGEVLAVGWNDVPRAFGGLYEAHGRPEDVSYVDHRCWNKDGGKCWNDEEKSEIAVRLSRALVTEGIVEEARAQDVIERLRRSPEVRGLIEFSRAVHAEMHALLNAGHSCGSRVRGGRLFVTTYPCHSCARHLIAAGIREVRFIEPYRKSLATRLHEDAITELENDEGKVRIMPFDGVAPVRFLELFSEGSLGRKDSSTGRMRTFRIGVPVTAVTLEAVTTLEGLALRELKSSGLLAGT